MQKMALRDFFRRGTGHTKLKVIPESVSITVEAGQIASEMVTMDNTEGLATGNFQR